MPRLLATLLPTLLACSSGVELQAPPETPLAPEAAPHEPLRVQPLRVLFSSSGDSFRALDGDPMTGWIPDSPPIGDGLFIELESPTLASELRIAPCRTGTDVRFRFDALSEFGAVEQSMVRLTSDGPVSISLPEGTLGWTLRVVAAAGSPCVAEMQLVADDRQMDLTPPQRVKGRVMATSTLAPQDAWSPEHLFDGREATGWVEGSEGLGQGEIITVELREPLSLDAIEIVNGYQRSLRHYRENARAKKLRVSADGGPWVDVDLADVLGAQVVALDSPRVGHVFRFALQEGYPGEKWEDLVLSELRLHDRDRWVSVQTAVDAARIRQRREEMDAVSSQPILDRIWRSVCHKTSPNGGIMKVRANGDFTWMSSSGAVLEGRWAQAPADGGRTQIELYGAWEPEPKDADLPSGGILTLQPARSSGEGTYHAWKKGVDEEALACLGGAPQSQLSGQGAMLISGPLNDALVPYEARSRR
jgi:hypothetical protein